MAEMTAAECIAALHNNQYQKHIGNGEYDYIHPLTDAEAKGVERLILAQREQIIGLQQRIEQQAQEIERQTKAIGIFMSANQSPETYRQVKQALEDTCKDAQQKR